MILYSFTLEWYVSELMKIWYIYVI